MVRASRTSAAVEAAMLLMIAGVVVLALTVAAFIALLPRGGETYRLAGTELEPYVGVAFTAAIALGFTMTLSGAIAYFG
jgi:hypothetical protein